MTSSSSASCALSSSRNGPPGRKSCDRRCTPWTPARLERAAHGLKGVLGALGGGGAAAVAGALEALARDGHLDAAPEELVQLEGAVAEVIAFLPLPAGAR